MTYAMFWPDTASNSLLFSRKSPTVWLGRPGAARRDEGGGMKERTVRELEARRLWEVRLGEEVVGFVGYVKAGCWRVLDAEGEPLGRPVFMTLGAAADRVGYDEPQAFWKEGL